MDLVEGANDAGADPEEDPAAPAPKDSWDDFRLPYEVATVEKYELRAYFQVPPEGELPQVEWLWGRLHAWCGITTPPGRMMTMNAESVAGELHQFRVPQDEYIYRGNEIPEEQTKPWKVHTVTSRCLWVVALWFLKNRSLKQHMKKKALDLLLGLSQLALEFSMGEPFMGMVMGPTGELYHSELHFQEGTWVCRGSWGDLLQHCPGALETWARLTRNCWMGYCITSAVETASWHDIMLFLAWVVAHPKFKARGQNLMACIATQTLPGMITVLGKCLSRMAAALAKKEYQSLPTLRTKSGQARRGADPVNRLILLFRLRKMRVNRRSIASTHGDLSLATTQMVQFEHYLDCMLHYQALMNTFSGQRKQLSVCWDPSSYGGKEIMVSAVYHPHLQKACWLMNQEMGPVMVSELDYSLLSLARKHKLTRVEGYKEIRALSAGLRSIGMSLQDFTVPKNLFCRPLAAQEFRIPSDDGTCVYIFDEESGQCRPEVPEGMMLGEVPVLLSISDQGPNNTAALNFLQFSQGSLMIAVQYDSFHRSWNDLKLAFRRASFNGWKSVLQLTMVANVPYGPFGTSQWWFKKRSWVEDYLATNDCTSASWTALQHLICAEKRVPEPKAPEDAAALFQSIASMPSVQEKGPLIKLMRWFSFFESMTFLEGQLWITKLILQEALKTSPGDFGESDGDNKDKEPLPEEADPKKELQQLKKRKGVLRLAPDLINVHNITAKDCMMAVGKATWKSHASRAREITSPLHVLEYNIACCRSKFWAAELEDMVHTSLWDHRHLQHVLPEYSIHQDSLDWHLDLLVKLMETRSMSLVSFHELPPNCYHHVMAQDPQISKMACDKACSHFRMLTEAEAASNQGANIEPLREMYWRNSPLVRTIMLAFDQDRRLGREGGTNSQAKRIQEVLAKNLGDSRVIEVGHQSAKDILRSSKSSTFGNTSIMSKLLSSSTLQNRKVDCVQVAHSTKVEASISRGRKEGVKTIMLSHTHRLPKDMQNLMVPKSKLATWPSPSPASLFQSAASTQWLFEFWEGKGKTLPNNLACNDAWKSVLATPGTTVAQRSTGIVAKVIASGEYSFLAWLLSIEKQDGETFMVMRPHRDNLKWFHLYDLEDWVVIPTKPALLNKQRGPVGWQKNGDAMSIELALCLAGLPITVKRMKSLIGLLGGEVPKGNASRKEVEEVLLECVVPEHKKVEARQSMNKPKQDEDIDSEFSEVLSELGQDEANRTDIKDLRSKQRNARLKRKGAVKDQEVGKAKKRKTGKGKGKGKGRGKGKGKGVKRKGLGEQFIGIALKRMKASHDQHDQQPPPSSEKKHPEPEAREPMPESEPKPTSSSSASKPTSASGPEHSGQEASSAEHSEAKAPGPSAPGTGSKTPAPKVYKSPEEILQQISPPGCFIGISQPEHRWTSRFPCSDKKVLGTEFAKQSCSASFALIRGWKEALAMVHSHCWNKYIFLNPGATAQEPGKIPAQILEALEPTIKSLPAVKRYTKE